MTISEAIANIREAQRAMWEAHARAAKGGHWAQREDGIMVYLSAAGEPMTWCSVDTYEALRRAAEARADGQP